MNTPQIDEFKREATGQNQPSKKIKKEKSDTANHENSSGAQVSIVFGLFFEYFTLVSQNKNCSTKNVFDYSLIYANLMYTSPRSNHSTAVLRNATWLIKIALIKISRKNVQGHLRGTIMKSGVLCYR